MCRDIVKRVFSLCHLTDIVSIVTGNDLVSGNGLVSARQQTITRASVDQVRDMGPMAPNMP